MTRPANATWTRDTATAHLRERVIYATDDGIGAVVIDGDGDDVCQASPRRGMSAGDAATLLAFVLNDYTQTLAEVADLTADVAAWRTEAQTKTRDAQIVDETVGRLRIECAAALAEVERLRPFEVLAHTFGEKILEGAGSMRARAAEDLLADLASRDGLTIKEMRTLLAPYRRTNTAAAKRPSPWRDATNAAEIAALGLPQRRHCEECSGFEPVHLPDCSYDTRPA